MNASEAKVLEVPAAVSLKQILIATDFSPASAATQLPASSNPAAPNQPLGQRPLLRSWSAPRMALPHEVVDWE